MFPPFPPDYPYGHPLNPYDTGNAVNPLSVFAVSNPILQAIRAGAGQLAPRPPQQAVKPPASAGGAPPAGPAPGIPAPLPGGPTAPPTTLGGWPGITPQPVPSPIGTTLDPTTGQPIESVTSTFDPNAPPGYWSSDPVTGNPVWVAPDVGAPIDLGGGGGNADTGVLMFDTGTTDQGMATV